MLAITSLQPAEHQIKPGNSLSKHLAITLRCKGTCRRALKSVFKSVAQGLVLQDQKLHNDLHGNRNNVLAWFVLLVGLEWVCFVAQSRDVPPPIQLALDAVLAGKHGYYSPEISWLNSRTWNSPPHGAGGRLRNPQLVNAAK